MEKGYFSKAVELRFCDCDYKKRAKLSTIMCYMADVAGLAYADKGYSHTWLWENDFVFLLSRMSIHINRMPVADETITVKTWESDIKGALFYRNFEIYDNRNTVIIQAVTAWVLANPHTRQIIKPSKFIGITNLYPDEKVDVIMPSRLKLPELPILQGERKIVFSDIDANNHVYNAVYASIACDFLKPEQLEKDIIDFRINFKQEAKLGEVMSISSLSVDSTTFVIGEVNTTTSFECEFSF